MNQKSLMLLVVLGIFVAFSGSLQAGAVIYEPFDDPDSELNGNASGMGLSGTWSSGGFDVSTGSLSYGSLVTSGNQAVISEQDYASVGVGTTLTDAGLLADGATLWFSVVWKTGFSGGSNPDQAFALGTDPLKGSTNNNVPMTNSGTGIGFTLKSETKLRAATWDNTVTRPDPGPALALETTYLIVGEIIWGADGAASDTINLYLPDTDLVPGTAVATHSIALDQSTFDLVTFSAKSAGGGVDEIRFGAKYADVGKDPMDPSPEDGETVDAGIVDMSWTNLAPVDVNDVYVDVLFGTEPNELNPGYNMVKIVDAGENTDAVSKDLSGVSDTYYWKVNSYVYGAAHINDANMIEGALWSFIAVDDMAPTVEIVTTAKMTWSGEGVPLDSTVTDDAKSAVTIEWSADLPDNISVSYSPGNDVADTTVTLTKVAFTNASIINAGFEDDELVDGEYTGATGWGWSGVSYRMVTNPYALGGDLWGGGLWPSFGGVAPEGSNVAQTGVGGIVQVLTETLAADTTYTLTAEVGNAEHPHVWDGYRVQLLAGGTPGEGEITEGTILAEDDSTLTIAPGTFVTVTVVFDSTGVDPDLLGEPLQIRLLSGTDPEAEPIHFDDVRLTADPPFILTGIQTVTMTVAVSDEVNTTPDIASVEIDVYDNACHLAQVGEGKSSITDINNDCVTGLGDLAIAAAKWLDDYSVTGPSDR